MNTEHSQQIITRFFQAIDILKNAGHIRGMATFANRYDINRRNLWHLKNDQSRNIFQPAWLTYLVNDYNISPMWLLTGTGSIFITTKEPE